MTFTGRSRQLAVLAQVLDEAAAGEFRLVAITGAAGIGKTRLAEEVAARARSRSWPVLWLRARTADRGAGFSLLRRMAQAAGRALDAVGSPNALLGERPGAEDLADTIADACRALSSAGPVLVVLDDVQDADPDSLAAWPMLADALRGMPVAVLATVRTEPTEVGVPLRPHQLLTLEPLTLDEAQRLLVELAPGQADDARELAQRSGGNPLLLLELAALGAHGLVEVPRSVGESVAAQLAALPPAVLGFVEAGAVLGVDFDAACAHEMAAADFGPLGSQARGLLTAVPGSRLTYRFAHGLVRDAVLAAMTDGRRRDLHARAARALGGVGAPAAVIADHHVAALGRGDDPAVARAALEAAAQEAEDSRAWQAALQARQRARSLARADPDPAVHARVECALADAHARVGAADAARSGYLAAATYAQRAGRADMLARAALGISGGAAGLEVPLHDADAVELLQAAEAGLGREPAQPGLRAHVLARLSIAETHRHDSGTRARLASEAAELARAAAEPQALAAALASLCDAEPGPEHVAARRSRAAEIVTLAARGGSADHALLGLRLRFVAELESGDLATARKTVAEFERVALRHDRARQLFLIPLWRATFALAGGDLPGAQELNARAAAAGQAGGSDHAFALTMSQRVVIDMARGAWSELGELIESALGQYPDLVGPQASLAWVHAVSGRTARCAALLTALTADDCAVVERDAEWLPTLAVLADAAAIAGQPQIAAPLIPLLAPHAEVFVVDGIGDAALGATAGYLAALAATVGDRAAAERHWTAALERNATAGLTVPLLRVRAARAQAGLPDATAAAHDLRAVHDEAAELGITLPPRADRSAAPPGRPILPTTTPGIWTEDGAVVRLSFDGRSAQLRTAKGTRILTELLRRPHTHVPATTLDGRSVQQSDTGPALDDVAKRAYRRRLHELESRIDAAALQGRDTSPLVAERDALIDELARSVGLRGRPRQLGSDAERARVNVTKAIAAVLRILDREHPAAAAHLRSAVRTGSSCAYLPDPAGRVTWTVRTQPDPAT